MSLICPQCQSKMRASERGGVSVHVCKQCRGVFVDRDQLELLMAAEARFFGIEPLDPAESVTRIRDYDAPRRPVSDDVKRAERLFGDDRKLRGKGKKRKKPFLEDFFE
jgi:Zn-finger nucleic acid-binding protein